MDLRSGACVVQQAAEADLTAWQSFVDRMPSAGPMHHAAWYSVLHDAYTVKPVFFLARDERGEVAGIMPMYRSRSLFTGVHYTTLEGGILAAGNDAAGALLETARRLQLEPRVRYVQLRGGAVPEAPSAQIATIHTIVPTATGVDDAWGKIKSKTRWGIRQAEKQGLSVEQSTAQAGLDAFYDLYAEHMRGLGTPVFSRRTLHAMSQYLGFERLRLYLISHRGKAIGGMVCLVHGNHWTDLYAIVRRDDALEFANYFLYWHVIRDAASLGVADLDLGRSMPGSNVHLFKRKWGGRDLEVPYAFLTVRDGMAGRMGLLGEVRKKGLRQRMWSTLPLTVCNTLGPLIRRDLPFL